MKKLMIGLFVVAVGWGLFYYAGQQELSMLKVYDKELAEASSDTAKLEELKTRINQAKNLEEIADLETEVSKLNKDYIQFYFTLKKTYLLFKEGEFNLRKAADIETALSSPKSESRKLHPLSEKYLTTAVSYYEKARKEIDKYVECPWTFQLNYNYNLNYLKGEIYYRILSFASTPETARELFNQTLLHYKKALFYQPADINTVINIELLIKNQNDLLGSASNPSMKKRQVLNAGKVGIGRSTGF